MRILIAVLIAIMPTLLFAQKDSVRYNKGAITGIVKDSADDYALQSVTITLYKKSDSTLMNYHITGEDGTFSFPDIPFFTPVNINFSFTGYNPFSRTITLDTLMPNYNFKALFMSKAQGVMDEVVVKAVVPVTMNGDTLEINPAAFKLDSNAVVEDMLRRVPGVTMWGDGTITVNGRTVNNVYVDGKPFFGNDPALATQNLPKNAIDKIQVYRETDYAKDNIDDNPADSLLTMNIKLREDKKFGYFGKAGAGIGTDGRYEGDVSGLAYNKKIRGGIAASINNINKTAGLQEMFRQGSYRNYNPGNRYVANFGSSGINEVMFIGGNMQYDFSQTNNSRFNNQLRVNYDFRNTDNYITSATDSRNSAKGDTVLLEDSKQETNAVNDSHSGGISYNKRDQDKDFSINANINSSSGTRSSSNFTTKAVEGGDLLSESSGSSSSKSKNSGVNFSTSFRNKDDDERNLKSFGINYNLSHNNSESESKTITDQINYEDDRPDRHFNRLNNNESSGFSNNLAMNYNALKRLLFGNFNLWNINLVLNNNISVTRSDANIKVSDYDSLTGTYIRNDSLTHNNRVTRIEDRPSLRLSKNFSKRLSDRFNRYINITANMQGQFLTEKNESSFDYRNINRSFNFFTPSASVSYNYDRFNYYNIEMNLSGNRAPSIPSVDQLRPIVDTSVNVYNIDRGGAGLQPSVSNAFNFSFNYRRQQSAKKTDYNFGISAGMSDVNNAIVDSSFYDLKTGSRTNYLINMDGRHIYNAGFNAGTSFKMKKNKVLQFNYAFNLSSTTSPNFIDAIYTVTKANNINNNLSVFYTLGDLGTVQVSQSINTNSSTQSGGSLKSLKAVNYVTQGNLNINPVRDLTISNTFNYITNNTTGQSSALWNAFATYRFLKTKQAEVKLSAMDILRQNKNIATSANINSNSLSTTVSNGLQQFFMVTFSYYPRRFGGARQSRGEGRGEGRPGGFERRGQGGEGMRGR